MDLGAKLRGHGLRATPQRAVILEVLHHAGHAAAGHKHLTAQQVFEAAESRLPGLNLATVYRALEGLQQAGLVDQLTCDNIARFAIHDHDHRHGHLFCRSCQRMKMLDFDLIQEIAELVKDQTGFAVDLDHLTLTGVCSQCGS